MTAIAPLKIGRFRSLWLSSIFSNLGSFFYTVAASWLMLELTGSATWVGLMQAANTLPLLFLALAAGAIADIADRTKVMLASHVLMGVAAALMAVATWLDVVNPPLLLGLGLLIGVGVAFNLPAWQALVPTLVPRGMVAGAVALNSAGFNVARAIGPALGGLIVATAGAGIAFGINAVSFLGVIVVVVILGRQLKMPEPEHTSISNAIALGIRYARFTPAFRRLLGLLALFAIGSSVVQSVLPSRTKELGGDAGAYGLLLGAMGAGALVAAFTRHRIMDRLGERSVPLTITGFGIGGLLLGLFTNMAVATVGLLLAGLCWVLTLVTLNATTQTISPEWIRGRAMSLHLLAFAGVVPLGSILSGSLADAIGAGWAITVLSSGTVLLGLVAPMFRVPDLDDIEPPEFTMDVGLGGHPVNIDGGPVMVISTWTITEDDYESYVEAMAEVRLVRLSTGAYKWRLYRNVGKPNRFTEVFVVNSWDEHLSQHRRIDDASRQRLRRARSFDRAEGPTGAHLIAVDVAHPPDWQELVEAHAEMHRTDGSIPLDR